MLEEASSGALPELVEIMRLNSKPGTLEAQIPPKERN
jgi:hypothetical protein